MASTRELFDLSGVVAVVTGGGGGLGGACALGLADAGACVVLADVNRERLEESVKLVDQAGGVSTMVVADLSTEEGVVAVFEHAENEFGTVTCLINTVFVPRSAAPEVMTLEDWNFNLSVNLTSYFIACREAGRRMIGARVEGSIVNISSIAGSSAIGRRSLAYSVCKAGINLLTKELAVEWAKHRIRVNAIQPCQINTPGLAQRMLDPEFSTGVTPYLLHGIPIGRLGEATDVVGPTVFLASPAARFVTGVLLPVDGGNLAMNAGGTPSY